LGVSDFINNSASFDRYLYLQCGMCSPDDSGSTDIDGDWFSCLDKKLYLLNVSPRFPPVFSSFCPLLTICLYFSSFFSASFALLSVLSTDYESPMSQLHFSPFCFNFCCRFQKLQVLKLWVSLMPLLQLSPLTCVFLCEFCLWRAILLRIWKIYSLPSISTIFYPFMTIGSQVTTVQSPLTIFSKGHTFSYELFVFSYSCSRCAWFFHGVLVLPMSDVTCAARLCSFFLMILFSDLSFPWCDCASHVRLCLVLRLCALLACDYVLGLIEQCSSVSAGVSSPLSSFFSSLLLHSLEAIHDVSFNWFFPNKLGLIV